MAGGLEGLVCGAVGGPLATDQEVISTTATTGGIGAICRHGSGDPRHWPSRQGHHRGTELLVYLAIG